MKTRAVASLLAPLVLTLVSSYPVFHPPAREDMGCFKTPPLRNLENCGPYMHDGSFPTVKDALAHYIGCGNWNAHLDKEIHSLDVLTFDERDDLLQFPNALNGKLPGNVGPPADMAFAAKAATMPVDCEGGGPRGSRNRLFFAESRPRTGPLVGTEDRSRHLLGNTGL